MKKIFLAVVTALFVLTCFALRASAAELKVGYIDIQKVFMEYKDTKAADAKLESKGKAKTTEREKMVEAIRRMKDEMELLSNKGKEDKQAQIDAKIKDLQDFDKEARNELMGEKEEVLKKISKDIDTVITDYGKKNGFDIILNRDRRVLLFEKGDMDLTEDILRVLNK